MAFGTQIATLFASIGADTTGLDKGLGTAKKSMEGLSKDFAAKVLGITSAAGLAIAAAKGVMDSVSDWSEYNIQMDRGATATGMAADEYSRLIQAADDARVPMEKMTTALEMATKNGYPMTIESLGTIADKLKAIKDPSEKAKLATEIFGRGWADIMPFLDKGSAGIEAMTAAIDDNMIATDESIASSQDYATAVDDLTDAWTGFRNEVGGAVMPVLTNSLNVVQEQITQAGTWKDNVKILEAAHKAGKITWLEYNSAMLQNTWDAKDGAEAIEKLGLSQAETNAEIETGSSIAGDYAQSAAVMKAHAEAAATAQTELATAAAETAAKFREQKSAITSLDKNFGGIISLAKKFDDSLEEIVKQQKIMNANGPNTKEYKDAKQAIDDIKQSMTDLANQVVLDMFQATIAIGGITQAEADAYFQMAEDMGIISSEAAAEATRVYGAAIDTINGMSLDDKTGNVNLVVDDQQLQDYNAPIIDAYVDLIPDTSEIDAYLDTAHDMYIHAKWDEFGPPGVNGNAAGGPVYANTPGWVGERGPEVFVPSENGYIINHDEALRALSAAAQANSSGDSGARGGGSLTSTTNNYNLTMPTSSNPADIKTAFELMEAWAV